MKMNQALNVKKQKVKVKKVKPIVPLVMKSNEEKELQGEGKANDVNNEKKRVKMNNFSLNNYPIS